MERLQEERVLLELRIASVEDQSTVAERTTEQHIDMNHVQADIERVERAAEALETAMQVSCAGPLSFVPFSMVSAVLVLRKHE